MQHEMRMRHIVICGLSGSTTFFHIISYLPDFRGKKEEIEHKMCGLIFSTNMCKAFLVLRRTARDEIKNVYRSSCKVSVTLVRF